jgi:hypothetical protein
MNAADTFQGLSYERLTWLMHNSKIGGLRVRSNATAALPNTYIEKALVGEVVSDGETVTERIEEADDAERIHLPDDINVTDTHDERVFFRGVVAEPPTWSVRGVREVRHSLATRALEIALRVGFEAPARYDPEGGELWYVPPFLFILRTPRGDFLIPPLVLDPDRETDG